MIKIGTDESGKGDYFGSLVVAGVAVDKQSLRQLTKLNVRDSKTISDNRVKLLSAEIKKLCPHSVVNIGPEKYNELYARMHNLNRILAWGHARVIENLLERVDSQLVIADKFGDVRYIEDALMKKGQQVKLEQRPKAESNLAVAAASILARAEFLESLEQLSTQFDFQFLKGASQEVEQAAQILVTRYGKEILNKVAKVHFKTTEKVTVNLPLKADTETEDKSNKSSFERLWAPWRINYISVAHKSKKCIFCKALKTEDDRKMLLLHRGKKAFVMLNLYPYNNGHLMITPNRHVGDIGELSGKEKSALFDLVQKSVAVLKGTLKPEGFNIGMNLGAVAGAGVKDHLHIHVVPRWKGDTNFMPVVADTKLISQSLDEAYKLLRKAFDKSK